MKVIEVNPRGFCHGVVSAMQLVSKTIKDPAMPRPIYIVGDIVHNKNVSAAYEELGAITLNGKNRKEILSQIESGTAIITAHGIDPHLITQTSNRGINIVDATCKDVKKTHDIINQYLEEGYDVIYIGKHGHPEPEAAVGIDSKHVHLISNKDDLHSLNIDNDKIVLTNQTTISMWSLRDLITDVRNKYPQTIIIEEICNATILRQTAIKEAAMNADLTIVVGDPKSNNTNKLVEISETQANTKAIRIGDLNDLDISNLLAADVNCVAITSGASTPSILTKDVISYVKQFDKNDKSTHIIEYELDYKRIVPRGGK